MFALTVEAEDGIGCKTCCCGRLGTEDCAEVCGKFG
jgi:hypothetical protein